MSMFGALRLPRAILFGSGQRRAIGSATARVGRRALICTDARLAATPEFAEMLADLRAANVETCVYDQTAPDLPIESVLDCVARTRDFGADVVIGVGGGSCMDLAKVAAVLLTHGGDVRAYYGEFAVPGPVMSLIAVPTTSGTGSEVTPVAVIADSERGAKVGIASPYLIPKVAICDPELTLSCPPALTACSGADALTHAVEAFTTLARPADPMLTQQHVFVGKNVLSDHFARLAVGNIFRYLPRAHRDGNDLEAREGVMLAALAAGCAFGTAGTAAAHALQYPVGNLTHTAHGDGVATLLPFVMQYNRSACAAAFAELARTVRLDADGLDDDALSQRFVEAVAELLASIGIPRSLRDLGLAEGDRDQVAEAGLAATRLVKNNPRPLDLTAMRHITYAAYAGERDTLRAL
ncbi:MAG TPA: iron-containing alcohol dehydrogenase [Sphingomonas sp.]|nr:iron-containing alcohol dehydrogenase [Sphingomonas sp.]